MNNADKSTGVRETALLLNNRHRHLNPLVRQVVIVSWQNHDLIGHAKTSGHLAERCVLSIEECDGSTTIKNCDPAVSGSFARAIDTMPRL